MKSKESGAQPEFSEDIEKMIKHGWQEDEIKKRTDNAINYVAKFVPSFETATVGGPPLYGAQQIPGSDISLRVGEVSFPTRFYARSEIVKASSALTVANHIIDRMIEEQIIKSIPDRANHNSILDSIPKEDIEKLAAELAELRGYPKALSRLVIEKE